MSNPYVHPAAALSPRLPNHVRRNVSLTRRRPISARLKSPGAVLTILMLAAATAAYAGPFANSRYVPPVQKAGAEQLSGPLTADGLRGILSNIEAVHVFNPYEGRNDALRAQHARVPGRPLQGGEFVEVDLGPEGIFGAPVFAEGAWTYLAAVVSVDAQAVCLQVDVAKLDADAEVWVVDPNVTRAFGPYRVGGTEDDRRWLAAILGDEAVLMVRSPREVQPAIRVVGYSHVFLHFDEIEKALSCNVNIACETNADILSVATGTALLLVNGEWFCSGTLVNNELVETPEPLFLTANHCVCSGTEARASEIFWDYRSKQCGVSETIPLDNLARSNGTTLLATNPTLDMTLMRLDAVSVGVYGRTYAGWDTRAPVVGESVLSIHYPDASPMRISKGTVRAINQTVQGTQKLTEVHWDEGITEQGSSGGCLLFADGLGITGALSEGQQNTCGSDRSGNIDWFGSFRDFYPQISQYIDSATPSQEAGKDNCETTTPTPTGPGCAFQVAFANSPALLDDFRTVRDEVLIKTALGKRLVNAYYQAAPSLARAISASPERRGLFVAITAPFARFGHALRTAAP